MNVFGVMTVAGGAAGVRGAVTRRRALRTLGGAVLSLAGVAVLNACGSAVGQTVTATTPNQTTSATASPGQAATTTRAAAQMLQLYSQVYGKWLGDAVAGKVTAKDACASIDQLVNAALQTK